MRGVCRHAAVLTKRSVARYPAAAMAIADQGMRLGLRALNAVASSGVLDRIGARSRAEQMLHRAARDGTRAGTRASRTFASATKRGGSASRLKPASSRGVFDLTPTDEQQM